MSPDQNPNSTRCPKCNATVSPKDKFCDSCGAKLDQPRVCQKCGSPISPEIKFCENCGTPQSPVVSGIAPPPTPVKPVEVTSPVVPPTPPAPIPPEIPSQGNGFLSSKKNLAILGIVGAIVIIAVAFFVLVPMLSGSSGATGAVSSVSAIPALTTSVVSTTSTKTVSTQTTTSSLVPEPTQTIPAKYTVFVEVSKDAITGETTVRAVGPDLKVVKTIQVTVTLANGQVLTGQIVPTQKYNSVVIAGSKKPERVQATVVFYSGEQYKVMDQVV